MIDDFYDKTAKKFGGYGYGNGRKPVYTKEYPAGDPEEIFKEKLLELGDKDKVALDIGCADGKFTVSIAPFFKKVFGVETSKVNLDLAIKNSSSKNIEYSLQNARQMLFENSLFDLAYCRRCPTYYEEYNRILKPKGYYIEIGIGEMDTAELQKIFGKGQGYGKWNNPRLAENVKRLQSLDFKILFAENFYSIEYYPSYEEFDIFLQQVPIFEDFDSEKDRHFLQKYIDKFTTSKGIQLSRHRVVMVVQKN